MSQHLPGNSSNTASSDSPTPLANSASSANTVSAIAVIDLARELLQRGVLSAQQLEAVIGTDSFQISQQLQQGKDVSGVLTRRLPEQQLIQLWQLAEKSGDKDLGWQIGSQVVIPAQGILAHWIRHCQTLEQAFLTFIEHVHLLNASEHWQVERNRSVIALSFHYPQDKYYPDIALQRSLASIKSWGEYLTGEELNIKAVYLTAAAEQCNQVLISELFQCPVFYSQPKNTIQLLCKEVQKPLVQANALIAGLVSQQALACVDNTELSLKHTLTNQIEQLFRQDIQCYSQIEQVAAQLNMSRATLYRRLKAQQTSFTALLEKYRYHLWQDLVTVKGEENSVGISEQLGFTDTSSFYKARKRWLNDKNDQ